MCGIGVLLRYVSPSSPARCHQSESNRDSGSVFLSETAWVCSIIRSDLPAYVSADRERQLQQRRGDNAGVSLRHRVILPHIHNSVLGSSEPKMLHEGWGIAAQFPIWHTLTAALWYGHDRAVAVEPCKTTQLTP